MVTIHAQLALSNDEMKVLAGTMLGDDCYDVIIGAEDANVYKPDGSLLLAYRKQAIPVSAARVAYKHLRLLPVDRPSKNRGMASGPADLMNVGSKNRPAATVAGKGVRAIPVKVDGTISKTNYAKESPSSIAGFFDRQMRFPYCRQTAFVTEDVARWHGCFPFIQACDRAFADAVPERYAVQRARADRTHPDFVIPDTAFTTITVNRNWQTAVHTDAGDLPEGFGVMTVCRAGEYTGGYLVFPQYRVAVDIRSCDVLMSDVHEWHGNTPIIGVPGRYERISFVLYYRKKMIHCGSAAQELERAKHRKNGDPIADNIQPQ